LHFSDKASCLVHDHHRKLLLLQLLRRPCSGQHVLLLLLNGELLRQDLLHPLTLLSIGYTAAAAVSTGRRS
jgi:hypothetical protein